MFGFLQILFLCFSVFLLGGCDGAEEKKPIWEQVKIGDLAPQHSGKGTGAESLKAINFGVYIFEMPAEQIGVLDAVWQKLYRWPLRFTDYKAFRANSFLAGFGEIEMWNEIAQSLEAGGAKKMPPVSLLLSDGQEDELTIAPIYTERPVFYVSVGGSMSSATIGPGRLSLRIKARQVAGSRGVCEVEVLPVFSLPISGSVPGLTARAKAEELQFSSAGFSLKMSPGDFVLLGPGEYISDQLTLGSLFFSLPQGSLFYPKSKGGKSLTKAERKPAIRVFLLVCTRINA